MNLSKMTVVGLMLKKRMILYIQLFSSDALFKNLMLPDIPSLSAALSNLTRISGIVQLIYENSSLFRPSGAVNSSIWWVLAHRVCKHVFNIKCMLMLVSIPVTILLILMYTEQSYSFNSIDRLPRFHL